MYLFYVSPANNTRRHDVMRKEFS